MAGTRGKPADLAVSQETMAHAQVTRSAPRLFGRLARVLPNALGWLARSFERSQCGAELKGSFLNKLTSTRPPSGRLAPVLSVGATDASPRANTYMR